MALLRPVVPADGAPPAPSLAPVLATRLLPFEPDLTSMLDGLLGRAVTLTRVDTTAEPALTAVYATADGRPSAVITFDLALAASAGASLALIPAGQAQDWITSGVLSDDGRDNAAEILNVLAASFNERDATRHVKLVGVLGADEAPDGDAAAGIAAPAARHDFTVDVEAYPSGHMAVMVF